MSKFESLLIINNAGEHIEITGSPEYIQRLQEDDAFLQEQINQESQTFDKSHAAEDNVVTDDTTVPNEIENSNEVQDVQVSTWNDASTKLLISLYNELSPKLGKTFKLKTKKKLWEEITTKMTEYNYTFTSLQVENRWKTMERAFKKKTENNKKTGRSKEKCSYEKELEECMVRKSSVVPEYLLNSSDTGKNRKDLLEAAGLGEEVQENVVNNQEKNETESPTTSRISTPTSSRVSSPSNCNKRDSTTKELKELRQLKEKYFEENIRLKKQKLEAYEKRTAEIAKKNEMLQELLNKLAK